MEEVLNEWLGPVAADTWAYLSAPVSGPGTFVALVSAPISDTETMTTQVILNPEDIGSPAVVEERTIGPTELGGIYAGFQSSPVPLLDGTWLLNCRAKHDSATNQSFSVRVIKL